MAPKPLNILVAEDNSIVALDIEQTVTRMGHAVIGPSRSVRSTLDAIRNVVPDMAFLDVELTDGRSFSIASQLVKDSVPFMFITARTDLIEEAGYSLEQVIVKPFKRSDIHRAIQDQFPNRD